MATAAFTRDGETCNECGGAVVYNQKRAIWEHVEPEPNCQLGRDLEAKGFGREPPEEAPA